MTQIQDDRPKPKPDVVRTPTVQRWRGALARATAPDAAERVEVMLAALAELTQDRQIQVRFSNWTGLVRSLRGDLWDQPAHSAGDMLQVAQSFLDEHHRALVGSAAHWEPDVSDEEKGSVSSRHGPVIGNVARFRQITPRGVPVYSAKALFGFRDDGHLTLCHSSWLGLPPDYEPSDDFWGDVSEATSRAMDYVIEREKSHGEVTIDRDSLDVRPAPGTRSGQVLLPALRTRTVHPLLPDRWLLEWQVFVISGSPHGLRPDWVPVWMYWVGVPQTANTWQVAVVPFVYWADGFELTRHASLDLCVYKTSQDALNHDKKPVSLEVPGGPLLASAHDFPLLTGDQPGVCAGVTSNQLRSGTVYYHLQRGRDAFRDTIVPNAWPAGIGASFTIPGDGSPLPVNVTGAQTDGTYSQENGLTLGAGMGGAAPVGDVALDPDVILHEYAHSLLQRVQPDLYNVPSSFGWAIDEGLAFYFGASLNRPAAPVGQVRWGEYAYSHHAWTDAGQRDLQRAAITSQAAGLDFFERYNLFPSYTAGQDHAGPLHACGMVLARTLWDMRRILGAHLTDTLTLRALNASGGLQSEMESLAEAIIHYELERVAVSHHESLARLIFCSRGIAADAAIHDLHIVRHNSTDLVLAATEGGPAASCRISLDGGLSWNDLGTGGLDEAVALASVDLGPAGVMLFAGGEVWTGNPPKPTNRVSSYTLGAGALNTTNAWQTLPALPNSALGVLCLLALPAAAGSYWLFVGTEKGLLRFRSDTSQWQTVNAVTVTEAVFDLALAGNPPSLVVCSSGGSYVVDTQTLTRLLKVTANYEMAGVIDGGLATGVVIGSAFAGVHRLDVATLSSTPATALPGNLPVFSLWAGSEIVQGVQQAVLYAGTNDGVYRKLGNANWETLNPGPGALPAESPENTTVVDLARVGSRLLAATTERGLWAWEPATESWTRITSGLPRTGRLTDVPVPANLNGWSATLASPAALAAGTVASHVLYLPAGTANQRLRFTPDTPNVSLSAYHAASHVELLAGNWAGLQPIPLQPMGGMAQQADTDIREGFYVLLVAAHTGNLNYQVAVTVDLV